jgi:crossover junction endodeoxyribonuclease RuvC
VRILAVDPGLTRCGVGVVDLGQGRRVSFVDVFVVHTPPSAALSDRLFALHTAIDEAIERHAPKRIALERVFAQHNLRTVMGTAQASGVVLALAGARGLPVALHTPSEVKAAVSGNGRANKAQVASAVRQILKLDDSSLLADATDALALAVCSAWREVSGQSPENAGSGATPGSGLTPAQQLWRDAERRTPRPRRPA